MHKENFRTSFAFESADFIIINIIYLFLETKVNHRQKDHFSIVFAWENNIFFFQYGGELWHFLSKDSSGNA